MKLGTLNVRYKKAYIGSFVYRKNECETVIGMRNMFIVT